MLFGYLTLKFPSNIIDLLKNIIDLILLVVERISGGNKSFFLVFNFIKEVFDFVILFALEVLLKPLLDILNFLGEIFLYYVHLVLEFALYFGEETVLSLNDIIGLMLNS